ncbi:MAG: FAD-dependent oxidoreductase [Deltaproteobacteria bacterium]|nr:FAD-dependent oxidoreductase [Deltaproteobacteria bacterium]
MEPSIASQTSAAVETTHASDLDYVRRNVPCQWACPAFTDVPAYILAGQRADWGLSYATNRAANLFPGVLGRICSRPCESACRHGEPDLGEPVSICSLKRAAADRRPTDHAVTERLFAASGRTVAVVGAGPAGLAAAHDLAVFGHRVTVYEALPRPGGMLVFGIPAFRLPRDVVEEEVFSVLRLGVQVVYGTRLGRDVRLADLLARHDAVVVAAGCYSPRPLGVPGETLPGVIPGLSFMMDVNEGRPPAVGSRIAVIGGGFTAMDCARSALRLGAAEVSVHLRTTEDELAVTREEVLETRREGVRFESLRSAVEVLGGGRVEAVRFRRNRLGTAKGVARKVAVPIEGSEFTVEADTVIAAIGQAPDAREFAGGNHPPRFDRATGACEVPRLYGAGDFVAGASTVIEAIGHARRVATAVDAMLTGRVRRRTVVSVEPAADTHRKRSWDFLRRGDAPLLPVPERMTPPDAEVELGLPDEAAEAEGRRCYLCDLKYEIRVRDCIQCRWCIDVCPRDCIHLASGVGPGGKIRRTTKWNEVAAVVIDNDRCIRCGNCLRICPTRCIHVSRTRLEDRLVEVR